MRIALYARVSSDRQKQDKTIASQIDALRDYASTKDLIIDKDLIFVDDGISGATLMRPALDALRDRAAAGDVEKVLVLCPDRLARKNAHQLILIEEFSRLGVEVTFANREVTDSPEDQLLLQIQGVIAEYEREKIMERSRRGKLHGAKRGKVSVLCGAPYGYVYIKKSDTEDARYEIHLQEAEVVRRIFRMYTFERKSIGEITRTLSNEETPTRKKIGKWERSVVWAILRNPAYTGKAAFRKTVNVHRIRPTKLARNNSFYPKHGKGSSRDRPKDEWIAVAVPAILDETIFQHAAERLEDNKRLSPRNNKRYEYLLSGLLHCNECGYALYGKPASNSKYKRLYYRCMGQDGHRWANGRVCSQHPVRVEVLDDLVWDQTERLLRSPDVVLKEYSERSEKKKIHKLSAEQLLNSKKRSINEYSSEKERLLDLYQSGVLSLKEIEDRLRSIRQKIKKAEDECALLEREGQRETKKLQLIEQFEDFSSKLTENMVSLSFAKKKEIVRLLVDQVVVDVNKADILVKHVLPASKSCPLRSGSERTTLRCAFVGSCH